MPMPIPLLAASSGTASSPTSFPGAGSSGNASLVYAPTTLAYDATGSAAAVFAPAALGASPIFICPCLCYWYWIFICTRCEEEMLLDMLLDLLVQLDRLDQSKLVLPQ